MAYGDVPGIVGESRNSPANAMLFFSYDDYTLNLNQISDINREDPESWVVTMASGKEYTLEGDDKARLIEALGL